MLKDFDNSCCLGCFMSNDWTVEQEISPEPGNQLPSSVDSVPEHSEIPTF